MHWLNIKYRRSIEGLAGLVQLENRDNNDCSVSRYLDQTSNLQEARVLIEQWRQDYNQVRPQSSLGYRPPAPEAILTGATT